MASPAGSLSCGLWGQARKSSPCTQAHPGAPFLFPPPEPRCPMSLRTLAGFPPRKGTQVSGLHHPGIAGTKEQGSTSPDSGTGLVFRCESLWLCAPIFVASLRSSVVHTQGTRPLPSVLPLVQSFRALSKGRGSVRSSTAGLLFLSPMVGLVRGMVNNSD